MSTAAPAVAASRRDRVPGESRISSSLLLSQAANANRKGIFHREKFINQSDVKENSGMFTIFSLAFNQTRHATRETRSNGWLGPVRTCGLENPVYADMQHHVWYTDSSLHSHLKRVFASRYRGGQVAYSSNDHQTD